jgi:hypothetical protein
MVVGNNESTATKNAGKLMANINCHGNAAVQRGAHRPMEHIRGFTRSHWMPPSVECLRGIAPAAAMADNFGRKHKN